MYQKMTIIGNVGRDGELKYTPQGVALCKFTVCVNKVTGKGDERTERATWFSVTLWRERAENLYQYIKKGQKIFLTGEISASAYIDDKGKPAVSLELNADEVKFLDSKPKSGDQSSTPEESTDIPF
jgi:single-strand DNA-binding protein